MGVSLNEIDVGFFSEYYESFLWVAQIIHCDDTLVSNDP